MMRIDKLISSAGIASRKEAALAAKRGGVTVNGVPVRDLSAHIDPEADSVSYLGRPVVYSRFTYVMLNKPEGYVSATDDPGLPVVTELLPPEERKKGMFPVGRLDRDTVGLMILTNNGQLAHSLLSPRHHVAKVYRLKTDAPVPAGAEDRFLAGIELGNGEVCKPATAVFSPDRTEARITLTEGKYHQIKRMIAAVGGHVTALERISFAGIPLDESLARGEWRFLTASEIAHLEEQGRGCAAEAISEME